jgi:hypothetical protein
MAKTGERALKLDPVTNTKAGRDIGVDASERATLISA